MLGIELTTVSNLEITLAPVTEPEIGAAPPAAITPVEAATEADNAVWKPPN